LQLTSSAGWLIVDDSYNANPASLQAAIEAVTPLAEQRWLVLGDMLELGPNAAELHAEAGRQAQQAGFQRLYATGSLAAVAAAAFGAGGSSFETRPALLAALTEAMRQLQPASDNVPLLLVKGSRASAMDRVADHLIGVKEDACCSG
jgi:UDP-N-acetylmuramoyl-tripeptide--D-alanyl-D-alanine ligase